MFPKMLVPADPPPKQKVVVIPAAALGVAELEYKEFAIAGWKSSWPVLKTSYVGPNSPSFLCLKNEMGATEVS